MSVEQPLYDRPAFLEAYLEFPRSKLGLDGASEWPTLRAIVGNLESQTGVDLGCGLGWFVQYAIEAVASFVDGFDISSKMIEGAKEKTPSRCRPKLTTRLQISILYSAPTVDSQFCWGRVELEKYTYDLAYSSLALHYIPTDSLRRLLKEIHASLKPGGRFVFSIEHPIFTAPSKAEFETLPDSRKVWPLDNYVEEGLRETNWLGTEGVRKFHCTIQTYLQSLLEIGFVIRDLVEWMPSKEDLLKYPDWKGALERPMFLLVKVVKA
ncbi:methyl transferase [Clohesyomyces aquaticus]|uniref:Methyl transferase n=1 Tax=Clohesyomyces aquaticus TaxID=1231657 RepID=A0A1Y1ZA33_9PLEO|nr:methyl transferase [Clohesyomyces aquaticus]